MTVYAEFCTIILFFNLNWSLMYENLINSEAFIHLNLNIIFYNNPILYNCLESGII